MSDNRELRTRSLGLRITPSVKQALDKAAADDNHPVASYVEKIIQEHLKAKGYLPK